MVDRASGAPRCAAFVGPYLSGKTTLLESILAATGAVHRKGSVREGNTVGDAGPESRARQMTTELCVASAEYLGQPWTFIDCPGSVELAQDALHGALVADTVVIVCEADPGKALAVAPLFKFLDDRNIPHMVFVNKMDAAESSVKAMLDALQMGSERPLVLREIPIRKGETVSGHVDLVSERAFEWSEGKASKLIELPGEVMEREREARSGLLETLSDFDDGLLEKLLEDTVPPADDIYANLTRALRADKVVPVFFGSALHDNGVRRLLKALRHEAPDPAQTADRLGIEPDADAKVLIFKTLHASQTGKLSLGRIFSGSVSDGMTLSGHRVSGLYRMLGTKQEKIATAEFGAVVGLGRLDAVQTGELLSAKGESVEIDWPEPLAPLYALAVRADRQSDEVKISGALTRLAEEDSSFTFEHNPDTGDLVIKGQGDVHLQIAVERLRHRYNLAISSELPRVAYRETIRKPMSQHARHKKQSGGHGQFADVHVEIKPLPRGSGFVFNDRITGGVVPKQYIPAVEAGVRDYLKRGPLGFPVVDVAVTLTDGQYHDVDSSEMAFKMAAGLAMREAMPKCGPVLLEPICAVTLSLPNEYTSKIQRLISGRRGHIQGFDAKPGWNGWDEIKVLMPQAGIRDLINELRSITVGVGTFVWSFDHLQEFTGKPADEVVAQRAEAAAQ
jgi:elongation factor G